MCILRVLASSDRVYNRVDHATGQALLQVVLQGNKGEVGFVRAAVLDDIRRSHRRRSCTNCEASDQGSCGIARELHVEGGVTVLAGDEVDVTMRDDRASFEARFTSAQDGIYNNTADLSLL